MQVLSRSARHGVSAAFLVLGIAHSAAAAPDDSGPYNARFLEGGVGIERKLGGAPALTEAGKSYSIAAWVRPRALQNGVVTLIAIGDPSQVCRCVALRQGQLLVVDGQASLALDATLPADRWTHIALVSTGAKLTAYVNGQALLSVAVRSTAVAARVSIAPVVASQSHFGGELVDARVAASVLDIAALAKTRPDFDLVQMWDVGVGWEWQHQASVGLFRPQDAWTLPRSATAYSAPSATPPSSAPELEPLGTNHWQVNGWKLAAAPDVTADGAALSRPSYDDAHWYAATVPGTVLSTLIDRGVYSDPYYGLNNLRITERLARQAYWYRTAFTVPPSAAGRQLSLLFGGINYAAQVWLNGVKLGGTRGAFIRGDFSITPVTGRNVIAVRVEPPPHPGIPHEQSLSAGVGGNGGQLAIDGPTFVATEGWDWIPGIRDRDTGIWRPVELLAHGAVRIGDPQVVTDLPLPRRDSADVYISVPLTNSGGRTRVTLRAEFDDVRVQRTIDVPAGASMVRFSPAEFHALHVLNPKLWWPNGYGDPALHRLTLSATQNAVLSDDKTVRFGIREVSYDLSLFDSAGKLRRVNVQTTNGWLSGSKLIDVRHSAIKQTPGGFVESLTLAGERSPFVTPAEPLPLPHLALRVNGVRIAARGGSWGMDDALKRVSRARLAPYFRLEREARLNVIRNWMGNNTEDEFYDLADENGMMILNDFWQSTQNFQVEPEDPALFLANARDTISRYRNHPSIVTWFGRNEGVPYPMLNEGLDDAVFELDGTRWYTGSSNAINLQGSGPYDYRAPAGYFQDLASGFSVETGTPSLATREAVAASMPAADRWPLSDTLAYHDVHMSGNGDVHGFLTTLSTMFGAATSFEDFERKAQLMNLETHQAIYEGFLGHLWSKNTGRLLWMTHPAWPSNTWQLYSSDYDTAAAYYGARRANEPLHAQLNLPGNELVVLNTTLTAHPRLTVSTRVVGLDNALLYERTDHVDVLANCATPLAAVPLTALFARHPMLLVSLRLSDAAGQTLSENFYWRGKDNAAYRALNNLAQVALTLSVSAPRALGDDQEISVTVQNPSRVPALAVKLTLVDAQGARILPAYYDDNYISLLPGAQRLLNIRYPAAVTSLPSVALRGWNITANSTQAAH